MDREEIIQVGDRVSLLDKSMHGILWEGLMAERVGRVVLVVEVGPKTRPGSPRAVRVWDDVERGTWDRLLPEVKLVAKARYELEGVMTGALGEALAEASAASVQELVDMLKLGGTARPPMMGELRVWDGASWARLSVGE